MLSKRTCVESNLNLKIKRGVAADVGVKTVAGVHAAVGVGVVVVVVGSSSLSFLQELNAITLVSASERNVVVLNVFMFSDFCHTKIQKKEGYLPEI